MIRLLVAVIVTLHNAGTPIREALCGFLTESPHRWTDRDDERFRSYARHPSNGGAL